MNNVSKKKEWVDNLFKAEIVKIVLDLIRKEQAVTMDEIAHQCGVAKGTLYNYFKNKKELLNYVHQAVLKPIRETHKTIFESSKAPRVRLHEFIDASFGIPEEVSIYFRFAQQKRTVASQINERFELLMRPLTDFCCQGIQDGSFVDVDPCVLAEMIYGTVIGPLISLETRPDKTPDMEKIKQDVMHLVDRIILK